MNPRAITRVVIVGGGSAGWMTAAALARLLPTYTRIDLVESDAIAAVGVGEATIPPIVGFNTMLGIPEDLFFRETRATMKLGIRFVDWRRIGHRYDHPFGSCGVDIDGVDFQHWWLRGRTLGDAAPLAAYSLAGQACEQRRAARPDDAQARGGVARIGHAFQFDASLYARLLRHYAEGRGVVRTEGTIAGVSQDCETGHVTEVTLADGRSVAGDFFIDCSGFRGLLIEQQLHAGFEDWHAWLPCDRAWVSTVAGHAEPAPYTQATAQPSGWQWSIPLQHRTGAGHVYSSAHLSDDAALATFLENLDATPLEEPRQIRFTAGRRKRAWIGNVCAIGLAGGFLEPLESTGIHLIQSGIQRLVALWPTRDGDPAAIARYNRLSAREYESVRDFLVFHYRHTERRDTPFWRDCQALPLPDALAEKIALFRASGRLFHSDFDLFSNQSWLAVLIGQGIEPAGYNPLADRGDDAVLLRYLEQMRSEVAASVAAMPTHADFLARELASAERHGRH